jgi:hypothetical protein
MNHRYHILLACVAFAAIAFPLAAEEPGTLEIVVDGPERWESGYLDRVLVEFRSLSDTESTVRVVVPFRRDRVTVDGIDSGSYIVAGIRYGYPDGSFVTVQDVPDVRIVVESDAIASVPIELSSNGSGPSKLSWPTIHDSKRVAVR